MPRCLARLVVLPAFLWLAPAHADALQDAQRLVTQGQLAQGLAKVEQAIQENPKAPAARFLKGVILAEMNKPEEAAEVYQRLIDEFPELPEPYNNLAVIHARQQRFEQARESLEMAILAHPGYATAHENLGDLHARLAAQAYEKSVRLDPANAGVRNKLGVARQLTGSSAQPVSAPLTDSKSAKSGMAGSAIDGK